MKRRTAERLDPLDLLLCRYHLGHWPEQLYRGQDCDQAHFHVLDLLAVLRSLNRRLDDDERALLAAAAEVGV